MRNIPFTTASAAAPPLCISSKWQQRLLWHSIVVINIIFPCPRRQHPYQQECFPLRIIPFMQVA